MKKLKLRILAGSMLLMFVTANNGFSQAPFAAGNSQAPVQLNPVLNSKVVSATNSPVKVAVGHSNNSGAFKSGNGNNQVLVTPNTCPKPIYDFQKNHFGPPSPGYNVLTCDSPCVWLDVRDSTGPGANGLGDFMEPAYCIRIQTDANVLTQNTFEVWIDFGSGSTLYYRYGPSPTGGSGGTAPVYSTIPASLPTFKAGDEYIMWIWSLCPTNKIETRWYDTGNDGSFPWYMWDPTTKKIHETVTGVQDKGTFAFPITSGPNYGTTGQITNWPGKATWSCPTCPAGSFTPDCGAARAQFCPNGVAPGKYGITYSWDNGILPTTDPLHCSNTYTDTITVKGIYNAAWNNPSPVCASGSYNLTSFLTGSSTQGGTWSGTGVTGTTFTPTGSGTFNVTYTAGTGLCQTAVTKTITVSPKPSITINPDISTTFCGSASTVHLTASGAVTYSWSSGSTTAFETVAPSSTQSYTVTGTDASSCSNTQSITITVNQVPAVTSSASANTNVKCKGGSTGSIVTASSGGSSPYTYSWNTSATSQNLSNVAAGTYTVTVKDSKNCTSTASVTITEPSSSVALSSSTGTPTGCGSNTGTLNAAATGGTGPYTYTWNPGGLAGAGRTGLGAGTYTVTAVDANGCTANDTAMVKAPAGAPVVTVSSQTDVKCNGDASGSINTSGGSGTFTISWNNGSTTANVSNLAAGTYTVTYTDNNSCTSSKTVIISQPAAIAVSAVSTSATCGKSNGMATANVSAGGVSPYTYSWSNGSTQATASGLSVNTFTVTVKDANNCTKTTTVSVTNGGGVTGAFSATPLTGKSPLKVDFNDNTTGATKWTWHFGDSGSANGTSKSPSHTYTGKGNYTACLVVENAAGCKDSLCKTISVEDSLLIGIPNIFSPNSDGKNDIVIIRTAGIQKIDIRIYDRWGLLMGEYIGALPEANGDVITWTGKTTSGTNATDGTYYYILKAYGMDTKTYDYKGFINLVR